MTASPARQWIPEWTLADRLRKIRRDRHLSQEKFAELIGVRSPTYSAWEAGRNHPDHVVDLARKVEQTTGVPAAWTLGVHAETPHPVGPGGASELVRHQGLEPRTRWFGRPAERRGFMPVVVPDMPRHPRRRLVLPLAEGGPVVGGYMPIAHCVTSIRPFHLGAPLAELQQDEAA